MTDFPDYIFEASWEVCNKVGGIYTVLASRSHTMQQDAPDRVFFLGPDVWKEQESPDFEPTDDFADWVAAAEKEGIKVRVGRWKIVGRPYAILVDFWHYADQKEAIYGDFWNRFAVDSLHAYGDYDESSLFGYAAGKAIESFYKHRKLTKKAVVAHFNEWMTAFGLLYLKAYVPSIKTLFTTHATTVGRSIAGNGKPLYDYLTAFNGDQMADELNVSSKHSAEKAAALQADCFTTVSEITNRECAQFFGRSADVITLNGFEENLVPKGAKYTAVRKKSRTALKQVVETFLDCRLSDGVLFVGTSGRYEYKNKGIDLFIDALSRLRDREPAREIVALIMVPAWTDYANSVWPTRAAEQSNPYTLFRLMNETDDNVVKALRYFGFENRADDRVKVLFAPIYLHENDGLFNLPYYDLLAGFDLSVFPSYYEPWGYTPMESAAFAIPTLTTNLAGFGQWISDQPQAIDNGVGIVTRSDHNYYETSDEIAAQLAYFAALSDTKRKQIAKAAQAHAAKGEWKYFFELYRAAYRFALSKR